jgi:hypothetical protein
MTDQGYYTRVGAYRDRLAAEELPNGIRRHKITVVMTDDSEAPNWRTIRPAVCHLPADRAREFALQLLALAQAAERWELAR